MAKVDDSSCDEPGEQSFVTFTAAMAGLSIIAAFLILLTAIILKACS